MYCDVVWGGFKVVWVFWSVSTVFSVTNKQSYSGFHNLPLIDMVFDWFTISYPQIQVIPMKAPLSDLDQLYMRSPNGRSQLEASAECSHHLGSLFWYTGSVHIYC